MLEFGPYRLDPDRREFLQDGERMAIQAKLFDTLAYLADHHNRVVTKEELLGSVWPDTHVEESTLFQTISALRKTLGCGKDGGTRYIATVPGQGYRFVAATTVVQRDGSGLGTPVNGYAKPRAIPGPPSPSPPTNVRTELDGTSRWRMAAAGSAMLLLAVIALTFWRSTDSPGVEPDNLGFEKLTSLEGMEWQPSLSPDARSFAYSGSEFGSADIFVAATAGGGNPLRRTFDPADELHPRWSPDGRYIAFLSDRGTGAGVYVISPYDGPERKLADTGLHRDVALLSGLGAQPWSPDGDSLLFPRRHADGSIAVWKIELGSGQETQLTFPAPAEEDREPSYSFDGRRIAFSGNRGGKRGVWIAGADGKGEKRVADPGNWPAWSSDDRALYVSAARSQPINIWRIDLESGAWSQVTRGAGQDLNPVVSPTGALAYASFNHDLHLYRTWLADGRSELLLAGSGRHTNARVSPDGRRVAYQSGRSGNAEIWILDILTGEELQLTDHPGFDARPAWSPGGERIVFRSSRDGAMRLWTVDARGGAPQRLSDHAVTLMGMRTASVEANAAPRWSPDGERIAYIAPADEGFAIWIASLDGKAAPAPGTRGAFNFDWYLDAERVILSRIGEDGVREMAAVNLATGRERVLYRGPHYELDVTPDGSLASFSQGLSHANQNLYLLRLGPPDPENELPRALGEAEPLTDGKGVWHVHHVAWFPDGESVVYTRDTDQADIFLVEAR